MEKKIGKGKKVTIETMIIAIMLVMLIANSSGRLYSETNIEVVKHSNGAICDNANSV